MSEAYLSYMGIYFLDTFYNHLFQESVNFKNDPKNNLKSITDSYKNVIYIYKNAVSNDMKTVIKGMHEDFQVRSGQDCVTFSKWLNSVCHNFVPPALVDTLDQEKRKNVVATVITDIVDRISIKVIHHQWLKRIIDERNQESIDLLTTEFSNIVWVVKEETMQKFISIRSDNKGISYELAQKLRHENESYKKQIGNFMNLSNKMKQIIALKNEAILKKDLELQNARNETNQAQIQYKILQAKYDKIVTEMQLMAAVPAPPVVPSSISMNSSQMNAPVSVPVPKQTPAPVPAPSVSAPVIVESETEKALKLKLQEMEERIKEMEQMSKNENIVDQVNTQLDIIENAFANDTQASESEPTINDDISMKEVDFGF